jgi:hypothetical protein
LTPSNLVGKKYGPTKRLLKMTASILEKNIPDVNWEKWAFENILLGVKPEALVSVMVKNNLDATASMATVIKVTESPYMAVARKYYNQMHKREWLLNTLDSLRRNDETYLKPKKVPLPPFKEFLNDYYFQNKVGIFTGAIDGWAASKWTFPELVKKVGYESMVEVQIKRDGLGPLGFGKGERAETMAFGEFVDKITDEEQKSDLYMTAWNKTFETPALKSLIEDFGDIGDGYFNMDAFVGRAFLWVGPKGSITPAHHDLTNNFFIQITGKKLFRMTPAMQVPYMYNDNHVFSDINFATDDLTKFPKFSNASVIEIELEPGDCLFIPIGWWHHVTGLTENISLSLTNMLGVNNLFPGHSPTV